MEVMDTKNHEGEEDSLMQGDKKGIVETTMDQTSLLTITNTVEMITTRHKRGKKSKNRELKKYIIKKNQKRG